MTDVLDPIRADGLIDESAFAPPEFEPFRFQDWPRPAADWERIERDKLRVDPVTLDVVEGALESAIAEAEAAIERTARSTIIREQHDYRASINTLDCESVTHVSWGATADPIRAHFDLEDIHEGDVFLYNDVYEAHGTVTHLPDFCVVTPVFAEGRLIAFTQVFGHTMDVGGRMVGSCPVTSTSIFEEGIQVPPVRIATRGETNADILKIVERNSRFPNELRGDLDAFVGAVRLMARRILELCDRLTGDVVEAAMYKLLDRCEETVREHILPQIPDGTYVGEDFVDNDGVTLDRPVKLKVTMRKDREKIVLDWTGTDAQTAGCINWAVGGRFLSKWIGAVLKQFAPGVVINEGVTRVVRCYIRPGTVLSPEYPAGVANRQEPKLRVFGPFTICLAQALQGEVVADYHCVLDYGYYGRREDGSEFLYTEVFGGGSGARPEADGTDAVDMIPNSKNLPAEFIEQRFPVVVEHVGLAYDSGGAGRYRGGLGYVKDIRIQRDGHFFTNVDRSLFGCFGVAGGGAGAPGLCWINPGEPDERVVQFSHEAIPVRAGDLIRITTPGGGGWGDPLLREPEAVRLDVERRLVSPENARDLYGVVVDVRRDDLGAVVAVDDVATIELRDRMRAERDPLRLVERGEAADELRRDGVVSFELAPEISPAAGGEAIL